jgi:sulfur relay protein TusB/DsrH
MLHLVFNLKDNVLLQRLHHQSGLIFLNNAVFQLLKNSRFDVALTELGQTTRCYVLHDDLITRGIESTLILQSIEPIDYAKFVQLTIENSPIQTWT